MPSPATPTKKRKVYFHWEGKERLSPVEAETIKTKTRRRAKRHFRGEKVRHRVVTKDNLQITFAFRRRTGKPVTIRWRREADSSPSASPPSSGPGGTTQ